MQSDEVAWQVIRHKHCSFMAKIETGIFCRNPYNVTGICNRSSCPLANSRYATIRHHEGVFYLYMKTVERAHMPNKLWERVKLPRNYVKALEIIDKHLMYWPKFLIHKMKQRLTKMTQTRIRMRKLSLKTREKIMTTPRKQMKSESKKEKKFETTAILDNSIIDELVARLNKGVYGKIFNYPTKEYNEETEIEYVEGYEELEEEEDIEDFGGFAIEDNDEDDGNGNDEDEELKVAVNRRSERKDLLYGRRKLEKDADAKSKKKPRVIVEVEHEVTDERQKATIYA